MVSGLLATWVADGIKSGNALAHVLTGIYNRLHTRLASPPYPEIMTNRLGELRHNLGLLAGKIGDETGEETYLKASVDAYNEALKEYKREIVPLGWATTQNNLGNVLQILGKRNGDETYLRQAIDAFNSSLQEYNPKIVPLDWATTQNNLGGVFETLGTLQHNATLLYQAKQHYTQALTVYEKHQAMAYVQIVNNNIAWVNSLLEAYSSPINP